MDRWIDCIRSLIDLYISSFACFPSCRKYFRFRVFRKKARFENKRKAGLQAIHTTEYYYSLVAKEKEENRKTTRVEKRVIDKNRRKVI
mmetsp:Transcript_2813/g.6056  ORF Transcript_2813/g.6056 Transcript_2813/m.6056 type:complete len:88 (-) Transcript_2813:58-321(-)